MASTLEQFLSAESAYDMVEILATAAQFRDFVGEWPESLEVLEQFGHGSLPRDPFSGETYAYELRRGRPVVAVAAPDWIRKKPGEHITVINVGK
jgi:hypothetical protein